MQIVILRYESLASTNLEALAQARRGAPEGVCIVAREQTKGRGRLGRAWISPVGAGLYLSLIVRPQIALHKYPLLTFAAALAVREAIAETSDVRPDIKYPNDVLINNHKVCGILAETTEIANDKQNIAAVIGIGINLTRESVAPDLPFATSLEHETSLKPDAENLLRAVLANFRLHYQSLHAEGGDTLLLATYAAHSSFAEGKRVSVVTGDEQFEGITCGLSGDGALRVETCDGELKIVRAGDVTQVRGK